MKFTLCGKINEFFTDSVFFKEENGKIDVGGAVGKTGFLNIIKNI